MNDELTSDERALFDRLREQAQLPPALEERVVASLHEKGLVVRRGRRIGRSSLLAAAVLAGIAGFAVGGWWMRPPLPKEPRWILLLYSRPGTNDPVPSAEKDHAREYGAWAKDVRSRGVRIRGERLDDAADGIASEGAVPVGADSELGGYFIVEGQDHDGALRIARSCPHLRHGGRIVVRQIAE